MKEWLHVLGSVFHRFHKWTNKCNLEISTTSKTSHIFDLFSSTRNDNTNGGGGIWTLVEM